MRSAADGRFLVGLVWAGVFLTAAGCGFGDDGWNRQAVQGTVTLKGQPLDTGTISFEPVDPSAGTSSGTEIVDGAFTMPSSRGLPPGEYIIRIYSADMSKAPVAVNPAEQDGVRYPPERIPRQWNSESKQTVTVVADGENQFELAIP